MKKSVFTSPKFFVYAIFAYVTGYSVLAPSATVASTCPKPPSHIQIYYQFDWSFVDQKLLMNDFQLKCGSREDIEWLVDQVVTALKAQGLVSRKEKIVYGN